MICDLLTDVSVRGPQTLDKISEQTSLLWEIATEFSIWQTVKMFPSVVGGILPPPTVTVLTGTPSAPLISPRFYSQVSNSANALVHTPRVHNLQTSFLFISIEKTAFMNADTCLSLNFRYWEVSLIESYVSALSAPLSLKVVFNSSVWHRCSLLNAVSSASALQCQFKSLLIHRPEDVSERLSILHLPVISVWFLLCSILSCRS